MIAPLPLYKGESESETEVSSTHTKYIHNVLTIKVSHDQIFVFTKMILTVHFK